VGEEEGSAFSFIAGGDESPQDAESTSEEPNSSAFGFIAGDGASEQDQVEDQPLPDEPLSTQKEPAPSPATPQVWFTLIYVTCSDDRSHILLFFSS
jgi:hypothetical protein